MALSGNFSSSFASGQLRLRVEWSATQSVTNNTSTITVKTYLECQYAVNFSASKSGSTTVDGTNRTWSYSNGVNTSGGWSKHLLRTETFTVNHNNDGTKSCSIASTFDINITYGSWVGTMSTSSTVTLDSIARASTITSSASWEAPNNITVNISRAATSLTHDVVFQVKNRSGSWVTIKTITGVATSTSSSFTTAQNKSIFTTLDGRSSADARIEVTTKSGSASIGTSTKTGTVSAPTASTIASGIASFNIGGSTSGAITRQNSSFTHTVRFKSGNTTIATLTGQTTSTNWTPSAANNTTMWNLASTSNSIPITVEVDTLYDGAQVRSTTTRTGTASVVNSNPTFGTGWTFTDSNSTVNTIKGTGNEAVIVQNQSDLTVTITSANRATANNGATMVRYVGTINGVERTANWHASNTITLSFGKINASANAILSIKAVDSRGNSTTTSKTVTIVPHALPTITANLRRDNDFETTTRLTVTGTFSRVVVASTARNYLITTTTNGISYGLQYRRREVRTPEASWGSWTNIPFTSGTGTYNSTNPVVLTLDNLKAFEFEIRAADRFGNRVVQRVVSSGRPNMFLDTDRNSVSFNMFPTGSDRIQTDLTYMSSNASAFQAQNPNNTSANVTLGYHNNIARLRYGGSGTGATTGFEIQGTSDDKKFTVNNNGDGWFKRNLTVPGNITVGGTIHVNASGVIDGINMYNNNLINVNHITINDPGVGEGIEWLGGNGWEIFESPDGLTNSSGNLQFTTKNSSGTRTRRMTLRNNGVLDVTHSIILGRSSVDADGALFYDHSNSRLRVRTAGSWETLVGTTRIATGSASITPVANTHTTVTVSYGQTFASAPRIVATPQTAVPGTTVQGVGVSDVTTTNFKITLLRTNTTTTSVHWIAIYDTGI